jgi:hypothetical protein
MPVVNLSDTEWQQVMALISNAPWRDANALLLKIGAQLQHAELVKAQRGESVLPLPNDVRGDGHHPAKEADQ